MAFYIAISKMDEDPAAARYQFTSDTRAGSTNAALDAAVALGAGRSAGPLCSLGITFLAMRNEIESTPYSHRRSTDDSNIYL